MGEVLTLPFAPMGMVALSAPGVDTPPIVQALATFPVTVNGKFPTMPSVCKGVTTPMTLNVMLSLYAPACCRAAGCCSANTETVTEKVPPSPAMSGLGKENATRLAGGGTPAPVNNSELPPPAKDCRV